MRVNPARAFSTIGPLLVVISIAWEYARMRSDYRFIVEPWSIRGYETTQGIAFAVVGAALLILGQLTAWHRSLERPVAIGISGAMVAAGTVIAAVFIPDRDFRASGLITIAVSLLVGFAAHRILQPILGRRISFMAKGFGSLISFVILTGVAYAILLPILDDRELSPPWLWIAILLAITSVLSLGAEPRALSANRTLVNAAVVAGVVIAISSGSLRSALIEAQIDAIGIAGAYKDTQITSGWLIANLGMLITFVGAVGLWAQRRDHILTQQRAAKQREAAEKSRAEIQAALVR